MITPVRSASSPSMRPGSPPGRAPPGPRRGRTGCTISPAEVLLSSTPLASKPWTSPAIREVEPRRVERLDRADPDLPAIRPSQVGASVPSALTIPMPVTTTRGAASPATSPVIGRASRSGPSRPGTRRPAGRARRSRSRRPACRTPPAISADTSRRELDQRPGRGRVAVEDVARAARVDEELPAEIADLGHVGVAAGDHPGVRPGHPLHRHVRVEDLVEARRLRAGRAVADEQERVVEPQPALRRQSPQPVDPVGTERSWAHSAAERTTRARRRSATGTPPRSRSRRPRCRCCPGRRAHRRPPAHGSRRRPRRVRGR